MRRTPVATVNWTVLRTFIGTEDPSIWLGPLSRNTTLEFDGRGPDLYFGSIYTWKTRMPSSRGSVPPGLNVLSTSNTRSTMSPAPSCAADTGKLRIFGDLESAANVPIT